MAGTKPEGAKAKRDGAPAKRDGGATADGKVAERITPPQFLGPDATSRKVRKVRDMDVFTQRTIEVINMLFLPKRPSREQRNVRIVRAIELYNSLAPAPSRSSASSGCRGSCEGRTPWARRTSATRCG